jgi:hypothetical protein
MHHAVFGKYGFLDDQLYIDPDGIAQAVEPVDPELFHAVLDLVLAHELTHALQDQHLDLSAIAGGHTGDAGLAVVCALEGHAAWVQARIAATLGTPEAAALVGAFLGYDASQPGISDSVDRYHDSYIYGQGAAFVDTLSARGGLESVWSMLANPPLRTAMIVHPDRYQSPPAVASSRLRRAAAHARDQLTDARWTTGARTVGDHAVRQTLLATGGDVPVASALVHGWSARAYASEREGLDVQILTFRDADAATRFVDSVRHGASATVKAAREAPGVRGTLTTLEVATADEALLESFALALPGLPPEAVSTATARRGTAVAQVLLVNVSRSEDALARALQRVLRRTHP